MAVQGLRQGQAHALASQLGKAYPYQALYPGVDYEGMGLFSRHPILSARLDLGELGATPLLVARVLAPGGECLVANMHPRIPHLGGVRLGPFSLPWGLDTRERQADVRRIVRVLEGEAGDAVLLGDMNTTDQDREYGWVVRDWRDAYLAGTRSLGLTYPVDAPFYGVRPPFPLFRIDHVFLRGDWHV